MVAGKLGHLGWREEHALLHAPTPPPAPVAHKTLNSSGLDPSKKYVTADMLDSHQEEDSVWFAYNGRVFDGTTFLNDHPGGADSILMAGGIDATEDFDAVHSDAAKAQLENFYIAEMAPKGVEVFFSLNNLFRVANVSAFWGFYRVHSKRQEPARPAQATIVLSTHDSSLCFFLLPSDDSLVLTCERGTQAHASYCNFVPAVCSWSRACVALATHHYCSRTRRAHKFSGFLTATRPRATPLTCYRDLPPLFYASQTRALSDRDRIEQMTVKIYQVELMVKRLRKSMNHSIDAADSRGVTLQG
jgi:hypothetical protein